MKKITINWGTGIVIAILAFMIFILSFVYKSVAIDKYQHQLVTDDYYKEELHYQEEIDKLNNANTLKEKIKIKNSNEGILISFPQELDPNLIKGLVVFKRMSNPNLDFKNEIKLTNHHMQIPKSSLVEGKWNIIIDWQYKDQEFLFKDVWFYQ